MKLVARFMKDESGATAIEYGLIAVGIGVFIITALQLVGGSLDAMFRTVDTALQNGPAGG